MDIQHSPITQAECSFASKHSSQITVDSHLMIDG